jgi:hypothetical protein
MFQSVSRYIMSAILNNNRFPLSANIVKWGLIIDIIPTTHDILLFAKSVRVLYSICTSIGMCTK